MNPPDPRPRRRRVLDRPAYTRLVRALLWRERECELCGKRKAESAHHAVSRKQGGDDIIENLVALCGDGVRLCHGEVEASRSARSRLRPKLRPEVVAYIIERKGEAWLDRKYPR